MKFVSSKRKNLFLVPGSILVLAFLISACSPSTRISETKLKMAPMSEMPADVQSAPDIVRESYQFAVANPELLQGLPCYCGCGPMGHTSNFSCYVKSGDGEEIVFDTHALGCGICVDITQDAMQMTREGKTLAEIRTAIDADYSRFGPSNMP